MGESRERRLGWAIKKAAVIVVALYLVLTVNFVLLRVVPSSGPTRMAMPSLMDYRDHWWVVLSDFRMNDSIAVQYLDYLYDTTRGDFSVSLSGVEVSDILPSFVLGTVFLLTVVVLLSALIGGPIISRLSGRNGRRSQRKSYLISVVLVSLPVTGFAIMMIMLYNWGMGMDEATVHYGGGWWHNWSSFAELVQSSLAPLFVSLVPTLGMYLVLARRMECETNGRPASASVDPRATGLRRYIAEVKGAFVGTSLSFASWAMCCVLMAEIVLKFDGLGSLMLIATYRGDFPVLAAAALACSMVTFAAVMSLRLMKWFLVRGETGQTDRPFDQSAAVTKCMPGTPWSGRVMAKDIVCFARAILGGFRRSRTGMAALILFCVLCVTALLSPYIAPVKSPWYNVNFDEIMRPPSVEPSETTGIVHLLGTDGIGRDVLSMVLYGSGAAVLAIGIVFVVSMAAHLSFGWLRVACARAPKWATMMVRPIKDAVGTAFLSVPVIVAIFCLASDDSFHLTVPAMAVLLAVFMALSGWGRMPAISGNMRDTYAHARDGMPRWQTILADALRSSKFSVLITLPVLAAIPFWDSPDAGLLCLFGFAHSYVVDYWNWWIVVPPVVDTLLLTVSAYVVIDVLEGSVRGTSDVSRAEPGPATHVEA